MKRVYTSYIRSAEEDTRMRDAVDRLKDDFDYIIAGLEKLDRSGKESLDKGLAIASQLQIQLNDLISEIGSNM